MNPRFIATHSDRSAGVSARQPRLKISYQAIGVLVALAEAGMITFGSAFGKLAYEWVTRSYTGDLGDTVGVGLLSSILYVSVARSLGLYCLPSLIDPVRHVKRIAAVCGFVLLSVTAVLFLLKVGGAFSRGALMGFAAFMMALCVLTRVVAAGIIDGLLSHNAIAGRAAFLIGETEELAPLSSSYLLRAFGLREVGRVALDRPVSAGDLPAGNERQDRLNEAMDLARASRAKEFLVAAKWDRPERLAEVEEVLRRSPLRVRLLPNHVFRSVIGRHASSYAPSVHLIELQRAPMGLAEQLAKRMVDIAIASAAILILMPIFFVVACAIKADSPGPIIFRQRRNGFDQRQFVIFKFRSMRVLEDGAKIVQARRGDRRVTRVGQVLRKTSIDELPQLFNVLKGDMSIVGPRPHALAHDDEYKALIGDYCMRHHVKPGITGWAQVNGLRGETLRTEDMQRRIELDVWYITNWSLMLDMQILVRTCMEVMSHDAY